MVATAELDTKIRLLKKNAGTIRGNITSSATLATYKDIVLSIKFYTATEVLLDTKPYTLYEFIPPGETKEFEIKGLTPPDSKRIEVTIASATSN